MSLDRLRRVTDLFVEGTELYLGMDDEQKAVVVWVNKLNSFEVEEARRDGVTARGLRLLELQKDDNPERMALEARIERWSNEELRQARVGQMADEIYLASMNDIEADEEWAEKVAILRRMPQLLADSNAPEDDPRRAELDKLNGAYLAKIQEVTNQETQKRLRDLDDVERLTIVEDFMDAWRDRVSLDEFMSERRMTEIFAAVRDCKGEEIPDGQGGKRWNHARCDHTHRLLAERSQVKTLPEQVIERIVDTIDNLTVPGRESGNSGAPASSSVSSEPSNAPEAVSTPSTPDETPPVAPTT